MIVKRNLTIASLIAVIGVLGVVAAISFAGASGGNGDANSNGPRAGDCEVTINYNTSVTQADLDEVELMVRALDADAEMVLAESWPPIGGASLAVDAAACDGLVDALTNMSYVESASWQTFDPAGVGDPDSPVSTDDE
jgi:hypothetical protein